MPKTATAKPKNPCAKTRPQSRPYEVWRAPGWEWLVLKKWQADDSKPYARWFLATKSPYTFGEYELGDGYVADVKGVGALVKTDYDS